MKRFAWILAAVMMALPLAACAGGNEPVGSGSSIYSSQNVTSESQTRDDALSSSGTESEQEVPDALPSSGTESEQEAPDALPSSEAESEAEQEAPEADSSSEPDGEPEGSKILVAYFSATNTTEGVAQKLAEGLGADLYEIVPEQPYTDEDLDYGDSGSRSSVEMNDPGSRPAISGSVENMAQYDVVLIGYPIWWGEAPRIMSTFIESYDFSGKTLAAFCTSASSGFGSSDSALQSAASGATWLDGRRFSAGASAEDVLAWANGLGISEK